MASFSRGTSFTDGVTGDVTASKLHALVDSAAPVSGLITDRTSKTSVIGTDVVLISDSADSGSLKKVTVANFANNLPTAIITTGTVGTLNTNTGTVGTLNTTIGTITTLTASTLTSSLSGGTYSGVINSTSGTFGGLLNGSVNSTLGTISGLTSSTVTASIISGGTLSGVINSTTGTVTTITCSTVNATSGSIATLTTTLAGDFTISQGTGTLGTTGVTAGTYGTSTIVPRISIDAKGRITSVGTSAITQPKILQVVQTVKTDTASVNSNGWFDLTGMSVDITPSSATSKVLISANLNITSSVVTEFVGVKFTRGTTDIFIGDAAGSRTQVGAAAAMPFDRIANNVHMMYLDSPASTSTQTYKIQWIRTQGGSIAYLNRSSTDLDANSRTRHASSIIAMEVSG